jgi:hypothetical protein
LLLGRTKSISKGLIYLALEFLFRPRGSKTMTALANNIVCHL